MISKSKWLAATAVACGLACAGSARAAIVTWVDWTSVEPGNIILGNIGGTVGVTYSGSRQFAQVTGAGVDRWAEGTPSYTGGLVNRPTGTDMIGLGPGGMKTLTFSAPVTGLYIALASWDGVAANFSAPFTVVSQGCGVEGCGSFELSPDGKGLFGLREAYGVIRFNGPVTTLSFTDTTEDYHGFTVGVAAVPEPATWAMMILGFGAAGALLRSRRRALA